MGFMFEFLGFIGFLVGVGVSMSVVLGIPLYVLMLIYRSVEDE